MPLKLSPALNIHGPLFILTLVAILLAEGCSGPGTGHQEIRKTAPADVLSSACINVHGKVFGEPMLDSKVSLHEISSLNYSIVMAEIRTKPSVKWNLVNETQGFSFRCLSNGNYAFVIPAWSYDGAVGSPLPYEFDCENISLEIAFQGGDHEYLVGVFSIRHTSKEKPGCIKTSVPCPKRGKPYHERPLERG